uniref:Uncharacterized protein n=1 Tax=Rhizophora mucronata TaxID=61149 RepID=A0A2P2KMM0_RHIMU
MNFLFDCCLALLYLTTSCCKYQVKLLFLFFLFRQ